MLLVGLGAGTFAWMARTPAVDASVRRLQVTGVVVAAPDGRDVRIAHDDIAGYMPAMTMAFRLAGGETTRLAPGDRVRFLLRVGLGPTVAEAVKVTGHGPMPGAAAPATPAAPAAPARLKRGDTVAPFSLIDERGRPLTERDLAGHPTVVTFIFTRCPVPEFCPLITSRFKALQSTLAADRTLPRDTQLLSVTLDPAFDTSAVLAAYGQAIGADPSRWRFAGGDAEAARAVARAFSVYVEKNGALLDHPLATALIGRDGRIVEIWRGSGWRLDEVTAALRGEPARRRLQRRRGGARHRAPRRGRASSGPGRPIPTR
jgi:protein SCO1/2